MTKKKAVTKKVKKVKLHKKTLKDLDSPDSRGIKGGAIATGHDTCYKRTC